MILRTRTHTTNVATSFQVNDSQLVKVGMEKKKMVKLGSVYQQLFLHAFYLVFENLHIQKRLTVHLSMEMSQQITLTH